MRRAITITMISTQALEHIIVVGITAGKLALRANVGVVGLVVKRK